MNKKLFTEIVFLSVGSFILIFLGTVVTINFFRDSRVFAKPSISVVTEPTPKKTPARENSTTQSGAGTNKPIGTFVYTKPKESPAPSPTPKETTNPSTKDITKTNTTAATNTSTNTGQTTKESTGRISIELINYTGFKSIGDEMRVTLEMGGFDVFLVNAPEQTASTQIIERSGRNAGTEVRMVLLSAPVIKALDPQSKYDVTVIIGDDLKP